MRLKILFILLYVFDTVFCMNSSQESALFVKLSKKSGNLSLAIETDATFIEMVPRLFSVRNMNKEKRNNLFNEFKERFSLQRQLAYIESKYYDPHIIVWFTDYFGRVGKKNIDWYKKQLFDKLPKATFWLVDLAAWGLLSATKSEIEKKYPNIIETIANGEVLSEGVCPLLLHESNVVNKKINTRRFKTLSSQSFFNWLLSSDQSIVTDRECEQMCRDEIRQGSLNCSLAQLGYRPKALNRTLKRLGGKNMLDVDFSLIYPVLQYLEMVFYIKEVFSRFEANDKMQMINDKMMLPNDKNSIVLLLPNKEISYFISPITHDKGETVYLKNQLNTLFNVLYKHYFKEEKKVWLSVRLSPFAYGIGFYDGPYYAHGSNVKSKTLKKYIKKIN